MESVRHKAILKSWIETGALAIVTRHLEVSDPVVRMSRTVVELSDFLDFLKSRSFIKHYVSREPVHTFTNRVEFFVAPDSTMERWDWGFDVTCDEPYFAQADYAYGWRFKQDPETGNLLIERFDKATEAVDG